METMRETTALRASAPTLPPAPRSIDADLMTDEELRATIQAGLDDVSAGRVHDARKAFVRIWARKQDILRG